MSTSHAFAIESPNWSAGVIMTPDPQTAADDLRLIDEDHALFNRLVERYQEALNAGRPVDEIKGRRAALAAHLDAHMGFEERLMVERGYPLAFSHAQEHKAFNDQVVAVLEGMKSGTVSPTNVGRLISRIHEHHIKNHDAIFCRYLVDRYSLHEVAEGSGI